MAEQLDPEYVSYLRGGNIPPMMVLDTATGEVSVVVSTTHLRRWHRLVCAEALDPVNRAKIHEAEHRTAREIPKFFQLAHEHDEAQR